MAPKKKGKQLNVSVLDCKGLKPATSGPPEQRSVMVQLEVEDLVASTKVVSGSLDPVFNESFSVVLTSAAAPTLYLSVVQPAKEGDDSSKEEFLGHVKVNLGLLEDRPMRDVTYNLEKKSFNQEVTGEMHVKVEYTGNVELDPEDESGFKKSAYRQARKGGVLEFYMKEIDKLRAIEGDLEKRVEKAEPQVKELNKKMERREEIMRKLEQGQQVLEELRKLEDQRKELQEMYKQAKAELDEKDVVLRRKDKQIMQLEMQASQKTRMVRKMSMQMSMRETAAATKAATEATGEAAPEPKEEPVEPSAALEGMGPMDEPEVDDDAESLDDDEEELLDDEEPDTSNASKDVRLWMRRFEKEKQAKNDWKDKCIEMEQLYNEMLQNKQKSTEDEQNAAKSLEEIEQLREECDELKMTAKLMESQLEEAMKKYRKEAKERKKLYNEIQELKGNIRVYCRCRPISKAELDRGATDVTSFGELDDVTIYAEAGAKNFEFDSCFDQDTTQEAVFVDTQPLMQSVLDGFNVCIFAYGQTGSGKTFTMQGPLENPGVNMRALKELFHLVQEKGGDYDFEMSISILEIYCDQIRDLLNKSDAKLSVKQEKRGARVHNYVDGLTQSVVTSVDDVLRVIDLANTNRSTASTDMNAYSSRSHLVMTVDTATIDKLSGKKTQAALHMVDLAGSERVGRSNVQGQGLKEAQSINQSLSALGNVLAALGRKDGHVPYRNSKLTHVLADALGGNSKVLMFCNISPSSDNVSETLSSLQFATRARSVELGKATANVSAGGEVPAELADDEEPAPKAEKAPAAAKSTPTKPAAGGRAAPSSRGAAASGRTAASGRGAASSRGATSAARGTAARGAARTAVRGRR